jgi:hypothetical protein
MIMRNVRVLIVISALGLVSTSVARAEDPAPVTTEEERTTVTTETAPPPGTVITPTAPATNCGPMGYGKVDKDLNPGRSKRITGGMLVVLGIATLVPGAAMLGWSERHDPRTDQPVDDLRAIRISGAVATALGAASVLVGIPIVAKGYSEGKRERERRITLAPTLAPRNGGGMAALGGTF